MSTYDLRTDRAWLVVGTRHDGSQLVLGQAKTLRRARRQARQFRRHLEGYRSVAVEQCGDTKNLRRGTGESGEPDSVA